MLALLQLPTSNFVSRYILFDVNGADRCGQAWFMGVASLVTIANSLGKAWFLHVLSWQTLDRQLWRSLVQGCPYLANSCRELLTSADSCEK